MPSKSYISLYLIIFSVSKHFVYKTYKTYDIFNLCFFPKLSKNTIIHTLTNNWLLMFPTTVWTLVHKHSVETCLNASIIATKIDSFSLHQTSCYLCNKSLFHPKIMLQTSNIEEEKYENIQIVSKLFEGMMILNDDFIF